MKHKLLTFILLALTLVPSAAQTKRKTVDPASDELAIYKMRSRMEEIRNREHRQTVAVVLSGGGAKGAAHVGALRFIEECGIPVDLVLGTSMGGLVGGLYALGHSPEHLDSLMSAADWSMVMSDKVDREFIPYPELKYKEKFMLSFPFTLSGGLDIGADDLDEGGSIKQNLLGSLPSGYIEGQNVNNIFSCMSVGYQDRMDFLNLPVPFVCIATDMVSCRAKIWHEGEIKTALRSTMSIPGVFAPVKTDGMVLVDGGMRNNFPTDIAREMGADYIIGVELSEEDMSYSQINNLGDLLMQCIDLLGYDTFSDNVDIPDVFIKPDLKGYNMLSFDSESIHTIIQRGYEAAQAQSDALHQIANVVGTHERKLSSPSARDIATTPIYIDRLYFSGLDEYESMYVLNKIKSPIGPNITKDDIENAVSTIFGTGAFTSVTYDLHGNQEPYALEIKCQKGPSCRFGLGGRFDSESLVSALVNVGINTNSISGSALDLTAKVASNPYLDMLFRFNGPSGASFNADAFFGYTDAFLYELGESMFNVNYWKLRQRVYFSNIHWKSFDVKVGGRNEFLNVTDYIGREWSESDYKLQDLHNDYLSAFVDARNFTYNDGYFPSRGHNVGLKAAWTFGGLEYDTGTMFDVQFDAAKIFPISEMISLIPSLNTRMVFAQKVPLAYNNVVGGSMAGRYVDQQIPFIGLNYAMPTGNIAGVLRTDLRFRLSKNNYITGTLNYLAAASSFNSFDEGTYALGVGVEYAYDSMFGPLKLTAHWSQLSQRLGLYLSMGFDF